MKGSTNLRRFCWLQVNFSYGHCLLAGYSEARRVLRPGGSFVFNVWDRIEENAFADDVTNAVATAYCQGTPLRSEIEARGASLLQIATDRATQAIPTAMAKAWWPARFRRM